MVNFLLTIIYVGLFVEFIERSEARKNSLAYYFMGEICKNGHIADRVVSTGGCTECIQERNEKFLEDRGAKAEERLVKKQTAQEKMMYAKDVLAYLSSTADPDSPESFRLLEMELSILPKTRSQAKYLDEKFYYDNVACDERGHFSKKITKSGGCVQCYKEKAKERVQENNATVKAASHARRARILNADGTFTSDDVYRIFVTQTGLCTGCLADLILTSYHIDHIMPLSKGGSNWPDNLQLLCPTCNLEKSAKLPEEWEKIAEKKRKKRKGTSKDE